MKFEVIIENGIKYTVRHMAGGDLVDIQTPMREKAVRGFFRKVNTAEPEMRQSA